MASSLSRYYWFWTEIFCEGSDAGGGEFVEHQNCVPEPCCEHGEVDIVVRLREYRSIFRLSSRSHVTFVNTRVIVGSIELLDLHYYCGVLVWIAGLEVDVSDVLLCKVLIIMWIRRGLSCRTLHLCCVAVGEPTHFRPLKQFLISGELNAWAEKLFHVQN